MRLPTIGILRGFSDKTALAAAEAAAEAGLAALETAMNTPGAAGQIRMLSERLGERMSIGAGTVTDPGRLDAAIEAGASYIVTPGLAPDVQTRCAEIGLPCFPGALTPSEAMSAQRHGASWIKLFPADQGGPAYVKSLKGPLDDLKVICVGGVKLDALDDWLDAGADGFGFGATLFDPARIADKDWAWMQNRIDRIRQAFLARQSNRPSEAMDS